MWPEFRSEHRLLFLILLLSLLLALVGTLAGCGDAAAAAAPEPDDGLVEIRFRGEPMGGLPWEVTPEHEVVHARRDVPFRTTFFIKNLSDQTITAHADRHRSAPRGFLSTVEVLGCFCIIQQTLGPGEEAQFPVWIEVDGRAPAGDGYQVEFLLYPIEQFKRHSH